MCPISSQLGLWESANVQQSGATDSRMTTELIKGVEGLAVEFAPAVHSNQPAIRVKAGTSLRPARDLHPHKSRSQHPLRVEVYLEDNPDEQRAERAGQTSTHEHRESEFPLPGDDAPFVADGLHSLE